MQSNKTLRNGLNVSRWLDNSIGAVRSNPDVLPRAHFPRALVMVRTEAESRERLATLDQGKEALAPAGIAVTAQDGAATASVSEFLPGHYRIHYKCSTASLMRVGNAYFEGWTARAAGRKLDVVPVDHALIGVVVPAGEGDLDLDYRSLYFLAGAGVTLCSLVACLGLVALTRNPKGVSEPRYN
jgi:hypothetical protein